MARRREGTSAASGSSNRTPSSRRRCFARTIRWATVRSSDRKARAIWPVVNPKPTRRVSAIWAARGRAGWQDRKMRRSSSSSSGAGGSTTPRWRSPRGSLRRSWRSASTSALCATRSSHRSMSATAGSGCERFQRSSARIPASCTAFSTSERRSIPKRRTRAATRRPCAARNASLSRSGDRPLVAPIAGGASLETDPSFADTGNSTVRAGAAWLLDHPDLHVAVLELEDGAAARERDRLFERGRLDEGEAADRLLCFHERPLDDLSAAHGQTHAGLIAELVRLDRVSSLADRAQPAREFLVDPGCELRVARSLVEVGPSEQKRILGHRRLLS